MTQHPVPQNVIEVEFKLFGSFTLKQFSKILIGGVVGVVIFLLPLPGIIKLPLSALSVLLGLGMAIAPNLGTWLAGFTKAMFVSPRYVWIREASPPDILKAKEVAATTTKDFKVTTAKKTSKIDLDKIDLKQIYGTQSTKPVALAATTPSSSADLKPDKVSEDNFVRVYEDVFGEGLFNRTKESALNQYYQQEFVEKPKAEENLENKIQYHKEEIERLKFELSMLSKDEGYKQKEEQILSRINDLYQELKVLTNPQLNANTPVSSVKNQQTLQSTLVRGKVINGIVVDKKDIQIANAVISFVNKEKNVIYRTKSTDDGKFTTGTPIPEGKYVVVIDDAKHKFHTYLIDVNSQNLPAFKFREK